MRLTLKNKALEVAKNSHSSKQARTLGFHSKDPGSMVKTRICMPSANSPSPPHMLMAPWSLRMGPSEMKVFADAISVRILR